MKSTKRTLLLSTLLVLGQSTAVQAGPSGVPELCDWYPGIPECSCNINPYNVVCGLTGWGGTPDLRDGVTPPDPQMGVYHVHKQAGNPYTATCWSSSIDRYNYARWEVLHGYYGGDEWLFVNRSEHMWFFVVYSDLTLSEGYAQSTLPSTELYQEPDMRTCGRPPLSGTY
ncbi:MAG TPA: hypothetical protein VJ724_06315 [Tahibacter sp.]|nr:hypothetical protein [Tahibacter sp.]